MKGISIARLGLTLGAGLLSAALVTGARAQEGEMMKNLLATLGVIDDERDPIEYRERAPLVLPPRTDLPTPVAPGTSQARSPQWPNDPNVMARKRREAEANTPVGETDRKRMLEGHGRLTPAEMRAGTRAGAGLATGPVTRSDGKEGHWMHPDVLRAQGVQRSAEVKPDDGRRRTLTDPPSAYRKSATGRDITGGFEVQEKINEADPRAFQRQVQQQRN
ncbi:MAG TPA: hypothetical protein VHN20_15075 [Beijerinckiaceae bacterium]|nr:hypothetical protein [Beijerinckiaceae bacterium]